VHISQLADRYVKDPSDVVKAGNIVKVRVVEIDIKRKRIALSMRTQDTQQPSKEAAATGGKSRGPANVQTRSKEKSPPEGSLGAALSEALRRR
jgi:uncharacterized protein